MTTATLQCGCVVTWDGKIWSYDWGHDTEASAKKLHECINLDHDRAEYWSLPGSPEAYFNRHQVDPCRVSAGYCMAEQGVGR